MKSFSNSSLDKTTGRHAMPSLPVKPSFSVVVPLIFIIFGFVARAFDTLSKNSDLFDNFWFFAY